ncbi:RICIN domain-containing protein [Streptomyces sp. NPDC012888]|uniref:RICIN domain-containing protein n=1 Tax=Streptomyces sp. NPDC012888 TaxID=3364855 RepID=UPI0036957D4A
MKRISTWGLRATAAALTASACLLGGTTSAQAAQPDRTSAATVPGGAHQYRHVVTGKCLDIRGRSSDDYAVVQQFDCRSGALNQQFVSQFTGTDPTTRLQPRHSGKCVHAHWPSSHVTQLSCQDAPTQRFELIDVGGGAVVLKNQYTGLCLDDAGMADGSRREVRQTTCTGHPSQGWVRQPV